MKFLAFFALILSYTAAQNSPRRVQRELRDHVSKMHPGIKNTVLGLKAQGVPDEAIASRIKYAAPKDKHHKDVIDGIVLEKQREDPKAKQYAKKRDTQLKNAIRQEEKVRRQNSKKLKRNQK